VRGAPLFAPVVVRSRTSRPVNGPSAMVPRFFRKWAMRSSLNAAVCSTALGLG
jgi:hypothetical protein